MIFNDIKYPFRKSGNNETTTIFLILLLVLHGVHANQGYLDVTRFFEGIT